MIENQCVCEEGRWRGQGICREEIKKERRNRNINYSEDKKGLRKPLGHGHGLKLSGFSTCPAGAIHRIREGVGRVGGGGEFWQNPTRTYYSPISIPLHQVSLSFFPAFPFPFCHPLSLFHLSTLYFFLQCLFSHLVNAHSPKTAASPGSGVWLILPCYELSEMLNPKHPVSLFSLRSGLVGSSW